MRFPMLRETWAGMDENMDESFFESLYAAFKAGDANVDGKIEEANNVRHVEKILRILIAKDFAALSHLFADEIVLDIIGSPANPMAGQTRGREQVIEATRNNFALLEEQQLQVESVVAQGDTVVVVAREHGRFVPTGKAYDFHWVQVYTFKADTLVYVRELADSVALMEAATP